MREQIMNQHCERLTKGIADDNMRAEIDLKHKLDARETLKI